jgi:ElaB/YqjD/DUF883 family membrane-anchored ribosome-binding protein
MTENDKNSLGSKLQDLPGLNKENLEDIENRLKDLKERTSSIVKEYPLTSIAVALGVGLLIGKLLSGRRHE